MIVEGCLIVITLIVVFSAYEYTKAKRVETFFSRRPGLTYPGGKGGEPVGALRKVARLKRMINTTATKPLNLEEELMSSEDREPIPVRVLNKIVEPYAMNFVGGHLEFTTTDLDNHFVLVEAIDPKVQHSLVEPQKILANEYRHRWSDIPQYASGTILPSAPPADTNRLYTGRSRWTIELDYDVKIDGFVTDAPVPKELF
jgi:hypothetical protein